MVVIILALFLDTLMSAIDEENRDEDDFVHISYSGSRREEGACGSNE